MYFDKYKCKLAPKEECEDVPTKACIEKADGIIVKPKHAPGVDSQPFSENISNYKNYGQNLNFFCVYKFLFL